jgi:hypothetical protein
MDTNWRYLFFSASLFINADTLNARNTIIMIATITEAMEPIVTASQCMTNPLYVMEAGGTAPLAY